MIGYGTGADDKGRSSKARDCCEPLPKPQKVHFSPARWWTPVPQAFSLEMSVECWFAVICRVTPRFSERERRDSSSVSMFCSVDKFDE